MIDRSREYKISFVIIGVSHVMLGHLGCGGRPYLSYSDLHWRGVAWNRRMRDLRARLEGNGRERGRGEWEKGQNYIDESYLQAASRSGCSSSQYV